MWPLWYFANLLYCITADVTIKCLKRSFSTTFVGCEVPEVLLLCSWWCGCWIHTTILDVGRFGQISHVQIVYPSCWSMDIGSTSSCRMLINLGRYPVSKQFTPLLHPWTCEGYWCCLGFWPWRWGQYVSPKCWHRSVKLYDAKTQYINMILTTVITLNLIREG
jgi:hypothetical protein